MDASTNTIRIDPGDRRYRTDGPPPPKPANKGFLIGNGPGTGPKLPEFIKLERFVEVPGSKPATLEFTTGCKWPVGPGLALFCNGPLAEKPPAHERDPVTYRVYCAHHYPLSLPRR